MPRTQFVNQFVKRVSKTKMLVEKLTRECTRPRRSKANIAAVDETKSKQPSTSIWQRSQ